MTLYFVAIFLLVGIHGMHYYMEQTYYYRQPHGELFFFTIAILFVTYKVHINTESLLYSNIFIFLALVLLLIFHKLSYFLKGNRKIIAKQSSFWNMPKSKILDKTAHKILEKKNRRELKINKLERLRSDNFLNIEKGKKVLSQNYILLHLKEYDSFTILGDDDIEKYLEKKAKTLYKEVFKKIQYFIDELEIETDYEEVFRKNKNCVEFFLMELWEQYSPPFSYGIGTLQTYVCNKDRTVDEEAESFLFALLSTRNQSVHRKGFALYYYYHFFKNKDRGVSNG